MIRLLESIRCSLNGQLIEPGIFELLLRYDSDDCCDETGKRCEFLTSVSFAQNGSYIEMPSLKTKPEANITMIFSTEEENGVLVYNGESQHIAVELFRGRIRVSYDVGNYPVSNMFR